MTGIVGLNFMAVMSNPIPIYKRLRITECDYRYLLEDLYWRQELSQQQIARHLNVHLTTIEKHFKRYKLATRPYTECDIWQRKSCNLDDKQLEVLDGILLADGHLAATSVSARLTYGCKFRETLINISQQFGQLHFGPPWQSKADNWHFKSASYNDLKHQHDRWYPINKIVPGDVRLTPLSCYWWFIGDGYQVDYGLHFCTDSFCSRSLNILQMGLFGLGFETSITPSRGRLRVRGKSAPRMLRWIRNSVEIAPQYVYKWGNHRRQSEQF